MKNKIEEIIKIKYSIFIKGTTMIIRHYIICILSILLAMSSCKQADYFAVYKDGVLQIGKYTEKEADELVKQEQYIKFSGSANDTIAPWSGIARDITKVVIAEHNAHIVTSLRKWFSGCIELEEIEGLENLDTSNVTDMSYMFDKCFRLTSIKLSNFNTSSATDMSYITAVQ